MLMHMQMQQESAPCYPESVLTEQEYRNLLWARFMANVERDDDAANDALICAHGQYRRAQSPDAA